MLRFGCDLSGKRALIVGASRGIGAAISLAYAEAGADVAVAGRTAEALHARQQEIEAMGRQAVAVPLDLGNERSVNEGVAQAIESLGGLDIVVNSGGISPIFKRAETITIQEWDEIFDINTRGAFLLARAAGETLLRQRRGVVIFVSSIHEDVGLERLAAYAASKGALRMLARVLALEWAPRGVRVNVLAPGYVATDLTAGIRANPSLLQSIEEATPLGRMATPNEVAAAAVFMASEAAAYMTGTSLVLDGGWTAR